MTELILEELIIRFDGTVVEIFYVGRGDSERRHIAHLVGAELLRLDSRRGPTLNLTGRQHGGFALNHLRITAEQLPALQAIVAQIDAAIAR